MCITIYIYIYISTTKRETKRRRKRGCREYIHIKNDATFVTRKESLYYIYIYIYVYSIARIEAMRESDFPNKYLRTLIMSVFT